MVFTSTFEQVRAPPCRGIHSGRVVPRVVRTKAVFGRLRAPVVITTTEHANADELQVSTTVEKNTGDASASGCRSGTTPPTIASIVAKPQSAPVKSWIDRTSTQPTAVGLRWALGRGRTVTVGRPSVVWLCGLDGWSQPRAGWALERSQRP